jgi:hypothetical protein
MVPICHMISRLPVRLVPRLLQTGFCAFCLLFANTVIASVSNGDFSELETAPDITQDIFVAWEVDPFFGDPPSEDNGEAKFVVGEGSNVVQLQQLLTLSGNVSLLSFQYRLNTEGISNPAGDRDSFQATLLNPSSLEPLLAIDAPFFPSFFSLDNNGTQFLGFATSSQHDGAFTTITADISSLSGQTVLLEFLAAENSFRSDDLITTFWIDNVAITSIPEPSAPFAAACIALCLAARRRRES